MDYQKVITSIEKWAKWSYLKTVTRTPAGATSENMTYFPPPPPSHVTATLACVIKVIAQGSSNAINSQTFNTIISTVYNYFIINYRLII